ncbi:uncharacterized protein LOC114553485 [Perca flavescens]|uniref:uncharacterized protein LOC114553485 n=1 Tax=Perca flavescens TaxID=8167 RepID=UPI00106EA19E|nr:uncharacterized protein LOC114553485 [Perca flavescens]
MPNIRQMRKRERKTKKWTQEAMDQAKQEVEAGRLSLRQAAMRFGVPKSSLSDRVSGRVASDFSICRRSLLTHADEDSLVEYCLYSALHGFPLTKPQVLAHAWPSTTSATRMRRGPRLRGPIEDYFRLLTTTLEEHVLREKPRQIYNCDETGFQLETNRRQVIVPRGTKHAYRQAQGTREHITVLACLNAAGEDIPPFIIYKGGYPGGPYNKVGVPNALYGKSQAGYIDSELFRKWFVGHFLKFATQERPLLLLMDGHMSHLDPELVRTADFSGVTGDLSAVNHSFMVSKKEFSRVLRDSYQRVKDRGLVVAGFRKSGLYPLDPMAIDWSRVMPSGRGTSSPLPPTPSASSWAGPDVTHPITPSPPPQSPPTHPITPPPPPQSPPTHPITPPPPPQSPPTHPIIPPPQSQPAPILHPQNPPANPYLTHPLVTSGRITVDLAHLLAEINYNKSTGKVRRNITKARILTAQEMSDTIEEVEDRAARQEAQALARRDREQQRARDTSPAATSSTLPSGSRPSRRRTWPLGAAPATSSGISIAGPSAPSAPSCASHGSQLPATSGRPSRTSLPAEGHHHPPSPEPSTSGAGLGRRGSTSSSPSHSKRTSSSSSLSVGPTTSTGHTAAKRRLEPTVWRCGRCREPEPPEAPEGLVSWVQCDNCHKWFHTTCVSWEEDELNNNEFWCFWCSDV